MRNSHLDTAELLQNKLQENKLENRFNPAELAPRIKKVAYDVVRFVDGSDVQGLWRVENTPEGDVILAVYNQEEEPSLQKEAAPRSAWTAELSSGTEIDLYYKGTPITRLASAQLGIPADELYLAKSYLPKKLASTPALVKKVLDTLHPEAAQQIYQKHSELL